MRVILITQRNVSAERGADRDALEQDYVEYFESLDCLLVPLSNARKRLDAYFEELPVCGVVLSGGNSISPSLYKGQNAPAADCSPRRDETEQTLLDLCLEKKLPVFCQCRGCQFFNVFFGGTLVSDLAAVEGSVPHVASSHSVRIVEPASAAYLKKDSALVNSYHNQGFTASELSPQLKAFAMSEDGVIEGIYHPHFPIAGVMWHPERQSPDPEFNRKLLDAFLKRELFWAK